VITDLGIPPKKAASRKEVHMLTRWNDIGFGGLNRELLSLNDLRTRMDRLFLDFERGWGTGHDPEARQAIAMGSAWPRIVLYDAGSELRLRAELPGMSESDLDITVEQSSLTVRGARETQVPEGYSVHRQERGNRSFARSFSLPCRIDAEKTRANLKNGILDMTLPKVPEERPRQIRVQVS
jgi:HSP20 family protein